MEYQKIINLIGDDVESKFQTKDYVVINDRQAGNYTGKQIKIITNMLRSSLCDFSRAYILVKGRVSFTDIPANRLGKFAFKNCAPFRNCRLSINNTVVDDANFLDVVMPMYNLLEYSDNYNKTTGSMYNFDRDVAPVPADNIWTSSSVMEKVVRNADVVRGADGNGNQDIELIVPFTFLSTFFRSLEMPIINCEIELQLTWYDNCLVGYTTDAAGAAANTASLPLDGDDDAARAAKAKMTFAITDTKTYIPVVTLRSIESEKLLRHLDRGFTKTINWNKLSVRETTLPARRFDVMIEPTFQGVNRLFILCYSGDSNRDKNTHIFMPNSQIDEYNVTVDGRNVFESPINTIDRKGYENLRDIMIGNGDDYTVGSMMDYRYFKDKYKIIGIDLSRQRILDADPRAIQQINFKGVARANNIKAIFIMEESKDTILNFTQGTVKVI